MLMVFKIAASAAVIGGINLLARHNPQLGGWIAALPLISILSMIWLGVDGAPPAEIRAFTVTVLWGLVPTATVLGIIAVAMGQGLSLPLALGCGAVAWGFYTLAARHFGLLG
jgi:Na+/H+ antiporter NhaC